MGKDLADPVFKPITPNPFIVGNPVRDPAMFFGREAEFELVRKRFTDPAARGGLLVFCGERRSGKTSILFQILNGRLGPEFIPVLIDMQSMAIESEADFLGKVAAEIAGQLPGPGESVSPDYRAASRPAAVFRDHVIRLLGACPGRRLVLLFDEYELFENKIDAGVLSEDVLYVFANLMEHQSVFIVFTGSLSLEERRRDYWKLFLGKSLYRRISYLDERDAYRLITEPVAGRVTYAHGVVESIVRLTAGQPFYTQAVCQSVVDWLNEHRTREVTTAILAEVITGIINNPLPQMIFLWDGLEGDQRLVLALLAESLENQSSHAAAGALLERTARRYPLRMTLARASTALEGLFRDEMLLKDHAEDPGYAFRMDLWRLWVRRMHSVWQVMRELGLEVKPRSRRRPIALGALGAIVFIIVAAAFWPRGGDNPPPLPEPVPVSRTSVRIETEPGGAAIFIDGEQRAAGVFSSPLPVGLHEIRITAAGYRDTLIPLRVGPESPVEMPVILRAHTGGALIRTTPPGAEILVNGESRGRSPALVDGLPVPRSHMLEVRFPDYDPRQQSFSVLPDTTVVVEVSLAQSVASLAVTSEPPAATVLVDGVTRGRTPLQLTGLAVGKHRFAVRLAGYVPCDTSLAVTVETGQLHFPLRREPPGFLEITGDSIAVMLVDGEVVMQNTKNSRPRPVEAGIHAVRVLLLSGTEISDTVSVRSGEHVIYDYTYRSIRREPWTGSRP